MTVSSSYISFILIIVLNFVQGTLTPNGNVSAQCGSTKTFVCEIRGKPIEWTTSGLSKISRGPFLARIAGINNPRITSTDTGGDSQTSVSRITISGFSKSDNGGTIQCINANNSNVRGMASISVGLRAPANVVAKAESCNTVILQWTQPSGPSDIATSVNCTPPSSGCAECTTSPCTITSLNPSTEYQFTVTLNSLMCGTSMIITGIGTKDLRAPTNVVATVRSCDTVTLQWDKPSEPNDISTSVSCTPPSPVCAECTTSPCTITDLNPSTEYVFTVTLNSEGCRTSMNITTARTMVLNPPTNLRAAVESCDNITLQWDQPSVPNDIITSVSCTPPSPGCAECTTSPCTITGLSPSTEYVFTVTLNSTMCGSSMNTTGIGTRDTSSCVASDSTSNDTSPGTPVDNLPSSLAALVLIPVVLLIPLIYPLGVLIARVCCFRDKRYCEVFWCCVCCRKDKSHRCNSTELMTSPHPREDEEYQNVSKKKEIRFVTDGEANKDQIGNKQEQVVTYETVEQLGDDDGDVITDETVEQQQQEDGITYATLDFSGHRKGNINVVHSLTDDVTYAAV